MNTPNVVPLTGRAGQYERLLSEDEAIEILNLADRPNPKGALRWLMRTGRVAFVRLARGIVGFRRADLEACIAANRVPSAGG